MSRKIIDEIEGLINRWATDLPDDQFLEALDEMVERAETAAAVRREELETEGDGGNEPEDE